MNTFLDKENLMGDIEYWQTVGQWEEYTASLVKIQQKSPISN